jgi:hypothetical protein
MISLSISAWLLAPFQRKLKTDGNGGITFHFFAHFGFIAQYVLDAWFRFMS